MHWHLRCPLLLAVPCAFLVESGFYIKKTEVIENLNKIDDIVFDKTGTLTHNRALDVDWIGEGLTHEELAK